MVGNNEDDDVVWDFKIYNKIKKGSTKRPKKKAKGRKLTLNITHFTRTFSGSTPETSKNANDNPTTNDNDDDEVIIVSTPPSSLSNSQNLKNQTINGILDPIPSDINQEDKDNHNMMTTQTGAQTQCNHHRDIDEVSNCPSRQDNSAFLEKNNTIHQSSSADDFQNSDTLQMDQENRQDDVVANSNHESACITDEEGEDQHNSTAAMDNSYLHLMEGSDDDIDDLVVIQSLTRDPSHLLLVKSDSDIVDAAKQGSIQSTTQDHDDKTVSDTSTPISKKAPKLSYFQRTYQLAQKRKKSDMQQSSILNYFSCPNKMVTKPSVSQSKNSSHNQESKQSNKIRKSNKWNDPKGKRKCPFYKKITGTTFCVDAFSYGPISGITAYFLSHFHSDHYYGLNKAFNAKLYCNKITANLVSRMLHVEKQYITILPMHQSVVVDDVEVTLLDANHCPGSAMFVFRLRNGSVHLHTGDFRASEEMEKLDILKNSVISELYLDTTYCDPSYDFPSQKFVLDYVLATVTDALKCNKRCLVACGTYTIGKEKVFLAIAKALECKIYAQKNKLGTLQCLEIENFKTLFTSDPHSTFLHVLPIWSVSAKFLRNYLDQNADQFDCAIGFKPTGWTHTNNVTASGIVARQYGSISIYGVPYSEHSSYSEMRRFVQFTKPRKIIPTVNVGSPEKRREMNIIFQQWRS